MEISKWQQLSLNVYVSVEQVTVQVFSEFSYQDRYVFMDSKGEQDDVLTFDEHQLLMKERMYAEWEQETMRKGSKDKITVSIENVNVRYEKYVATCKDACFYGLDCLDVMRLQVGNFRILDEVKQSKFAIMLGPEVEENLKRNQIKQCANLFQMIFVLQSKKAEGLRSIPPYR